MTSLVTRTRLTFSFLYLKRSVGLHTSTKKKSLMLQVKQSVGNKGHISTSVSNRTTSYFISPVKLIYVNRNDPQKSCFSVSTQNNPVSYYMECDDPDTKEILARDMQVIYDFISEKEESQLFDEVEPYLRRLKYETSHWDDAIHGYRETERKVWSEKNKAVIQRVRDTAFPAGTPQLAYVHVLDLQKEGYIKPHVDAVKFCGNTIAGISLLSPSIMRLVHTEDKTKFADILLERRSLYIMKDSARYDYTHEVLPDESKFKGKPVQKDRRISVICRNEP